MLNHKMASSVVRTNSYLPYLPGASENDKFSDVENVELIEFLMLNPWREKSDLEGLFPRKMTANNLCASVRP